MAYIRWSEDEEELLFQEAKLWFELDAKITWREMIFRAQQALPEDKRKPSCTGVHHLPPSLRTRLLELTGRQIKRKETKEKEPVKISFEEKIENAVFNAMLKAIESPFFIDKLAEALASKILNHSIPEYPKVDLIQYAPAKPVVKDGRPELKLAILGLLPDQAKIVEASLEKYRVGFKHRLDLEFIPKQLHSQSHDYRKYDHVIQMTKFSSLATDKMKRSSHFIMCPGGLTSLIVILKDLGMGMTPQISYSYE